MPEAASLAWIEADSAGSAGSVAENALLANSRLTESSSAAAHLVIAASLSKYGAVKKTCRRPNVASWWLV